MKKYNLVTDTISKKELFKLSKWIRSAKKLTMGNLCIKFEKNFLHLFKENIRFLLIVALLQIY